MIDTVTRETRHGITVSTIQGPTEPGPDPRTFETLVWDADDRTLDGCRYWTLAEAVAGHRELAAKWLGDGGMTLPDCPCCAGQHESPSVLDCCDDCIGAWLNGQWPHGCSHAKNCTEETCPTRRVDGQEVES